MFEQCCGNRVEANSITHGGDGVFAFAGKQALGEVAGPEGPDGTPFDCERKGCNGNVFALNDLSFAAAHGLELTFSFDNEIRRNVIESNAICGLWLGYSRDTRVAGNRFFDNGGAGYGAERGAINAEHAQRILVAHNLFEHNALDVRLWSDADVGPAATPWGRVNGQGATDNRITANRSEPTLRVELREVGDTIVDVDPASVDADAASRAGLRRPDWRDVRGLLPADGELWAWPLREDLAGVRGATLKGLGTAALSDREALGGRETIVIDEWGPYDWTRPYLQPLESGGALARYRLLGPPGTQLGPVVATGGAVVVSVRPASADGFAGPDGLAQAVIEVRPKAPGVPSTYDLKVQVVDPAGETEVHALGGVLMEVAWTARFASWERDPREDPAALFDALEGAPPIELTHLDLDFGGGGPASVVADPTPELEALGHDRFGTWATTTLTLPPGAWRLRTVSDDGLRVQLDGETVLEDWTWHGPTVHDHVFRISEQSEVQLDVRHFELDGWARLTVELEAVDA
jgi:parallel beta-helix repeat protein